MHFVLFIYLLLQRLTIEVQRCRVGMTAIPKLKLGNIECGGGWGLGEQFAKLPSHDAQRAGEASRIFTLSKAAAMHGHSSDDEAGEVEVQAREEAPNPTASATLHTTQYDGGAPEDDDDTFVDHGSNTDAAPPRPPPEAAAQIRTDTKDGPAIQQPTRDDADDASNEDFWEDGRLVSRVHCSNPIYGMVIAGRSMWTAVGDDPLTLFELTGCDLSQQRSIASVVGIRSMVVVSLPAAKAAPVTFKTPQPGASQRQPLSRSNSGNHLNDATPCSASGSEFLWCGLDKGRIAIVDLFFFSEDGVISQSQAHGSASVCGLWSAGGARVWSAGDDHSLKLWDAATRKVVRVYKMSDVVVDVCYVPSTNIAWVTCRESRIMLFNNHDGQEVRVKTTPFIKTKSKVHALRYHAPSATVWAAVDHDIVVYNTKTYDLVTMIPNVSCRAIEFSDERTAVLIGHTAASATSDADQVIILDVSEVRKPMLRKLGASVPGISRVGFRCFPRSPLAVAAHTDGGMRCLTVFTTGPTEPLGNWGTNGDGRVQPAPAPEPRPVPAQPAPTKHPAELVDIPVCCPPSQDASAKVEAGRLEEQQKGPLPQTPLLVDQHSLGALADMQREIREVTTTLKQLKLQQPMQQDIHRLYSFCARIAGALELAPQSSPRHSNITPLLAALTVDMQTSSEDWSTSECRTVASTLHNLTKIVVRQSEACGTRTAEQQRAAAVPADAAEDKTGTPENISERLTAAFKHNRQLQHVLRSAEKDRLQSQELISSLQRQNSRLNEKIHTLLRGMSSLDGSLRVYGNAIVLEATKTCADGDDVAADQCELPPLFDLSLSSTSADISDAFESLQERIRHLFNSKQHLQHAALVATSSRPEMLSARAGTAHTPSRLPTGRDGRQTPLLSSRSFKQAAVSVDETETPSTVAAVRLTPKRLFAALRNELSLIEQFTRGVPTVVHCLEGSFCRLTQEPQTVAVWLDGSPVLHDVVAAELMVKLCRFEMLCVAVEELISAVSEAEWHDDSADAAQVQCWTSLTYSAVDRSELDNLISYMTTVSIDLETAAATIRKMVFDRYLSAAPAVTSGMAEVLERVRPSACRMRGLLGWEHVWLRCLALALDEVQSVFFAKSSRSGQHDDGGIQVPWQSVEFMLERIVAWRADLTEAREETETLFQCLSTGQRVAGGDWDVLTSGLSADVTRATLLSLCLQLSSRRNLASASMPSILLEEIGQREREQHCDDLYGLISDMLENIGAVLQTKMDALLPVCQKIDAAIHQVLNGAPLLDESPQNENAIVVVVPSKQKAPLEEAHRQFCLAV